MLGTSKITKISNFFVLFFLNKMQWVAEFSYGVKIYTDNHVLKPSLAIKQSWRLT